MAGDHLIASFRQGPDHRRSDHAAGPDALLQRFHISVLPDLERMALEGMDTVQTDSLHPLAGQDDVRRFLLSIIHHAQVLHAARILL